MQCESGKGGFQRIQVISGNRAPGDAEKDKTDGDVGWVEDKPKPSVYENATGNL